VILYASAVASREAVAPRSFERGKRPGASRRYLCRLCLSRDAGRDVDEVRDVSFLARDSVVIDDRHAGEP
jgi:hypothetical protein